MYDPLSFMPDFIAILFHKTKLCKEEKEKCVPPLLRWLRRQQTAGGKKEGLEDPQKADRKRVRT